MKLTELKKMIQKEITKILSEQPEPGVMPAPTRTKPQTSPSEEDDEFGTKPKPGKGTEEGPRYKNKKKAEEAAKKVADEISGRYNKILKNKK
jgi:hypothetical protein